jgi:hypothetical protein
MIEQSLNGEWQLRERDADEWLPGHAPVRSVADTVSS